jgi:RNA polymerase sigma-70 factor (ECF subfamily)
VTGVRTVARRDRSHGDPELDLLYESEAPRLLRYFQRRTGNCHTAPDLVQDAFVRLASTGATRELVNPAAYLQRIARNLLTDRARRRAGREALQVPLAEWDEAVPAVQEEGLIAAETLRRYEDAIADLPEKTRTIFLMQRAEGLTYRAIADKLGVKLWTVEHHMKQALAHLDRRLGDS